MKKQIFVRILKPGNFNASILSMIERYNEGMDVMTIRDLQGYLICHCTMNPQWEEFPTVVKADEKGEVYHISEDGGKTFTLTLEWATIEELITHENV